MSRNVASWSESVDRLSLLLGDLSFRDGRCADRGVDDAFGLLRQWAADVRKRRQTIYFVGNGASASMASHYAADFAKNGHLHTQVFSDLSLLTAIANDLDFSQVFAEPLRRRGNAGDMLVAISSSGESPNILEAVASAKELRMQIITLSGMSPANSLRNLGDLNAYVAAQCYGDAETCHASILHHWMDLIEIKE